MDKIQQTSSPSSSSPLAPSENSPSHSHNAFAQRLSQCTNIPPGCHSGGYIPGIPGPYPAAEPDALHIRRAERVGIKSAGCGHYARKQMPKQAVEWLKDKQRPATAVEAARLYQEMSAVLSEKGVNVHKVQFANHFSLNPASLHIAYVPPSASHRLPKEAEDWLQQWEWPATLKQAVHLYRKMLGELPRIPVTRAQFARYFNLKPMSFSVVCSRFQTGRPLPGPAGAGLEKRNLPLSPEHPKKNEIRQPGYAESIMDMPPMGIKLEPPEAPTYKRGSVIQFTLDERGSVIKKAPSTAARLSDLPLVDNRLPFIHSHQDPRISRTLQEEHVKDVSEIKKVRWLGLGSLFDTMLKPQADQIKRELRNTFRQQIENETQLAEYMNGIMESRASHAEDAAGNIINLGTGVFNPSERTIPPFTVLGCYAGKLEKSEEDASSLRKKTGSFLASSHAWDISKTKGGNAYLSGNILRNINTAQIGHHPAVGENNVEPVLFGKSLIFYVTSKDVFPNTEYLVSYGDLYNPEKLLAEDRAIKTEPMDVDREGWGGLVPFQNITPSDFGINIPSGFCFTDAVAQGLNNGIRGMQISGEILRWRLASSLSRGEIFVAEANFIEAIAMNSFVEG